jgi:hypothetical protein
VAEASCFGWAASFTKARRREPTDGTTTSVIDSEKLRQYKSGVSVVIVSVFESCRRLEHVNLFYIRLCPLRLCPSALKILANDGINCVFRLDGLVLMTA